MIYTVYIDVAFAVNTTMDVMVPAILNRVLSYRTTKERLLVGTVIGGIWSCVVSVMPGLPSTVEVLGTYVAVSNLMAVTAYHLKSVREIVRSVVGIYLVSAVFEGTMFMLYEHTKAGYYAWRILQAGQGSGMPILAWIFTMIGAVLACYGFSGGIRGLIRSMTHRKDLCRVTLKYGERGEEATGLIDTGNRLREPVSGQPVHVMADGLMRRLCPAVKGVVYIPYQSVGASHGILPVVYTDRMEAGQEGRTYCVEKPLVAITKQSLSPSGEHQILIQKTDEGT